MEGDVRRLWLLRHGESRAQTEEEFGFDTPLSEAGREQARMAGDALRGRRFDRVWISPLKRARETFELLELDHGGAEFDSRLAEILPSGCYYSSLLPYEATPGYAAADRHDAWEREPFGRVADFLEDAWSSGAGDMLAVTHGGVSSAILNIFIGGREMGGFKDLKYCLTGNGAISALERDADGEKGRLLVWNSRAHLTGKDLTLP